MIARQIVARHRMAGLGGRPQHDRTMDQIGFEPIATVQSKLSAKAGRQRNPALVVKLDGWHAVVFQECCNAKGKALLT
jgi:hypothetical protein